MSEKAEWQKWNHQGFIPGPQETESEFKERIVFCQNLTEELLKANIYLPFSKEAENKQKLLESAYRFTQPIYGIAPAWVPLYLSNKQLSPWHGGCAWIFQIHATTPMAAFLQLRKPFEKKSTYLGLYKREELIAHELSHVGRMMMEEPQFEEMIAYCSSSSRLQSWLGPIIESGKEIFLFILFLSVGVLVNAALLFSNFEPPFSFIPFVLPLMYFLLGLGRLIRRHRIFNRCQKQLENVYGDPNTARHVLYRLRDCEIRKFAYSSPEQIKELIANQACHSFRWRFLTTLYPSRN